MRGWMGSQGLSGGARRESAGEYGEERRGYEITHEITKSCLFLKCKSPLTKFATLKGKIW